MVGMQIITIVIGLGFRLRAVIRFLCPITRNHRYVKLSVNKLLETASV